MNELEPTFEQNYQGRSENLDRQWFEDFSENGKIEPPLLLSGEKQHRDQQKEFFLSGKINNPVLDYPELDLKDLAEKEDNLRELKKKVRLSVDDSDEAAFVDSREARVVRQAYLWRINESIATLGMLRAAAEGDMRRFERYNKFIYGEPSEEIFNYTVSEIRDKAENALDTDDQQVVLAAKDLLEAIPDAKEFEIVGNPSKEEFEVAKNATLEEFSEILEIIPREGELTTSDIRQVFQEVLDKRNIDSYRVEIDEDSDRTGLLVSHEKQAIFVPAGKILKGEDIQKKVVHESTHVFRRVEGERSRLQLLSLGLDRFIKGEEGITGLREQSLADEFEEYSGLTGQLAIGLARGLDGEKRDFRGVYEIMEKYFYLSNLLKDQDPEKAKEKAKNSAYKHCVRTFRGSDCKTPGVCYTKDVAYREGQIGVWQVVADSPDEIRRFSIGKYDPANKRHIWILDQLGITDDDLEELEK
jgi:hypothetical protein